MERLDHNDILTNADIISVFSVMRNEMRRLPYWLHYYRQLGVGQFFIIDNGSNDGTAEFLLSQPDCVLFQTTDSYASSRCGVDWLNSLLDQYGVGRWCMVVDVDELFVFSKAIGETLSDLVRAMDAEGAEGAFTLMIDMYSAGTLKDVRYEPGTPFLSQCNAFDARPYVALPVKECPGVNVVGGVRQRLFYPEYSRRSLVDQLGWKVAAFLKRFSGLKDMAFVKAIAFSRPPVISKVPFVKWATGREHISGAHTISPTKIFSARCALLHFKFFDDFHVKALEEIKRNQHYDGAREYRRYYGFFAKNPDFSFQNDNTVIYEGPETLERLSLITEPGKTQPADISSLQQ